MLSRLPGRHRDRPLPAAAQEWADVAGRRAEIERRDNAILRAIARLDAGMSAYATLRGRYDRAAATDLASAVLEVRTLLADAVKEATR